MIKKHLIIIVLLIPCLHLFAETVIDQREKIATEYFQNKAYEKAIKQYQRNAKHYHSTREEHKQVMSVFWMARSYEELNDYNQSLLLYLQILPSFTILKEIPLSDLAIIHENIAYAYQQLACAGDDCCSNPSKKLLENSLKHNEKRVEYINKDKSNDEYLMELGEAFADLGDIYELLKNDQESISFKEKAIIEKRKYIDANHKKYLLPSELKSLADSYDALVCMYPSYRSSVNNSKSLALYQEFFEYLVTLDDKYPTIRALIYANLAELTESVKDRMHYYIEAADDMRYVLINKDYTNKETITKVETWIKYHQNVVDTYDDYKKLDITDGSEFPIFLKEFINLQESKANNYLLAKSYFVMYKFYNKVGNKKETAFYIKKAIERIRVAIKKEKSNREEYGRLHNKYMKLLLTEEYARSAYSETTIQMVKEYQYFYKKYYWDRPNLKIKSYRLLADFFLYKEKGQRVAGELYIHALKYFEKSLNKIEKEDAKDIYSNLTQPFVYGYLDSESKLIEESITIQERMPMRCENNRLSNTYLRLGVLYENQKKYESKLVYRAYQNAIRVVEKCLTHREFTGYNTLFTLRSYSLKLAKVYLENNREKEFLEVMYTLKKSDFNEADIEIEIAEMYEENNHIEKMFKHLDKAVELNEKSKSFDIKYPLYRQQKYQVYAKVSEMETALNTFIKNSKNAQENRESYLKLLSKIYLLFNDKPKESLKYMIQVNEINDKKYKLECNNLKNDYAMVDVKLELGYEDECEDEQSCREMDIYKEKLKKLHEKVYRVCRKI